MISFGFPSSLFTDLLSLELDVDVEDDDDDLPEECLDGAGEGLGLTGGVSLFLLCGEVLRLPSSVLRRFFGGGGPVSRASSPKFRPSIL